MGLAFLFGYTLTSIPLLRSGMALAAVVPIALAADTVWAIDNAVVLGVPEPCTPDSECREYADEAVPENDGP